MAEANVTYREYETIVVLKPDIEDAKVIEVTDKLRSLVNEQGGKSIKFHNWGKKKLAFEVDKQQKGIFMHHLYVAPPATVSPYERMLKYLDEALLYQTIRLNEIPSLDARAAEEDVLTPPVRELSRRDRDEHDDREDRDDRDERRASRHHDDRDSDDHDSKDDHTDAGRSATEDTED